MSRAYAVEVKRRQVEEDSEKSLVLFLQIQPWQQPLSWTWHLAPRGVFLGLDLGCEAGPLLHANEGHFPERGCRAPKPAAPSCLLLRLLHVASEFIWLSTSREITDIFFPLRLCTVLTLSQHDCGPKSH